MGRIVLLLTSPRVAPGLLTWPAWEAVRSADVVYAADLDHPQAAALHDAGVGLTLLAEPVARGLVEAAAADRQVVWLAAPSEDPASSGRGLGHALGQELTRLPSAPELEILPGSYDLPGARLLDLIGVMDRLRRECPWVQAQSHRSLVRYLVEEAYETVEAIESGDHAHLREELGDLLFQVVFHARLGEELPERAYAIDDVTGDLVEKLIRRNPHVFGTGSAREVVEIENVWDQLKSEEKRRASAVEGVPAGLPALAYADKLLERVARTELAVPLPAPSGAEPHPGADAAVDAGAEGGGGDEAGAVGNALLVLVDRARRAGVDPEQALRDSLRRYAEAIRAAESEPRE